MGSTSNNTEEEEEALDRIRRENFKKASELLDVVRENDIEKVKKLLCCDEKSEEKVKFLKLAWDIIGSEFAGRHEQYEKFYAGPPFVAKSRMYQAYDFKGGDDLVKSALDGYNLEGVNRK